MVLYNGIWLMVMGIILINVFKLLLVGDMILVIFFVVFFGLGMVVIGE